MSLGQMVLNKLDSQNGSAPFLFSGLPEISEPGGETGDRLGSLVPVLEWFIRERTRPEIYQMATRPEILTYNMPLPYGSMTTSIDSGTPFTHRKDVFADQSPSCSSVSRERSEEVRQAIMIISRLAREELFEDGVESDFSRELVSVIENHGNAAVKALSELILGEEVDAEVASETLRWLGQIEHPETYDFRLWSLEQSLYCSSARVRDGAALGLAFLDDPRAILFLRDAIQRELYPELREDMEQILEQLENSQ